MKRRKVLQRAIAMASTLFMLGGTVMQESGISFAADRVYAADGEEEDVSGNEASLVVSEDAVSEDTAEEPKEDEAVISENTAEEPEEEEAVSENVAEAPDSENAAEEEDNGEPAESSGTPVSGEGKIVYMQAEDGSLVTWDLSDDAAGPSLSKTQLEEFYAYDEDENATDGVKLALTEKFREALNNGGSITAGDYTWNSGDPVPDPGVEYAAKDKTYKITSIEGLFRDLRNVTMIDLSGWDSEIERPYRDMSSLFEDCESLEYIDKSGLSNPYTNGLNLNTPECTDMAAMFDGCSHIKHLALYLTTSKVKKMNCMFEYCSRLKTVTMYTFETPALEEMAFMFAHCSSLEYLNLENFDECQVKEMWGAFADCRSLKKLNLSNFDFSYVEPANGAHVEGGDDLFRSAGVNGLDIYVRDEEAIAYITDEYNKTSFNADYQNLVIFDLNALDDDLLGLVYEYKPLSDGTYQLALTENVSYCYGNNTILYTSLMSIKDGSTLPNPDSVNSSYHGKISSYRQLFWGLKAYYIDASLFTGENVTDMTQMFQGCNYLRTLWINNLKPGKNTDIRDMFGDTGCGAYRIQRGHQRPIEGYAEARAYDTDTVNLFKDPKTLWSEDNIKFTVRKTVTLDRCGKYKYWYGEQNIVTFSVEEGKCMSEAMAAMTYPGFTLQGWYLDKEYTKPFDTANTPITKDITLYAKWKYDLTLSEKELEYFYDYVYGTSGYRLQLTEDFKNALNEKNGQFTIKRDDGVNEYVWSAGDPLPNPGATHRYGDEQLPVDSYNAMFLYCNAAILDLSTWDTSNAVNMSKMFERMFHIKKLDVSSFDTSKVTTMRDMFVYLGDDAGYENLDLRNFDVSRVTDFTDMFEFSDIKTVNIDSWKTPAATSMEGMFWCCRTNEIYMRKLDIPEDCSFAKFFHGNHGFRDEPTNVYLKNSDMRTRLMNRSSEYGEADLRYIVDDEYGQLSDSDLEKFYVYTKYEISYYKVSLTDEFKAELDKSNGKMTVGAYTWQTGDPLPDPTPAASVKYKDKVISYAGMFAGSNAGSLDLSEFSTKDIDSFADMFKNCKNIKKLDLSGFRIDASDDVTDMLKGTCASNSGTPVMGVIDDEASASILNDSSKTGIDLTKLTFKKMYVIRFDAGGGSGTMPDMAVDEGGSITLPECSFTPPEGASFEKWDGDKFTPEKSCTVKALWTHIHSGVKTDAKEPDCTTKGNIEYWTCKVCGAYFRDQACREEISLADTELAALGHEWGEWVVTDPATEGHDGMEERTCYRNAAHKEQRTISAHAVTPEWEICFDDDCLSLVGENRYEAEYTGQRIKPYVRVVHEGRLCALGVDYTLKYGKNTAAGNEAGTVTVKGKGSIKGQKTLTFSIAKKDLSDTDVAVGETVCEPGKDPDPVVAYHGMLLKKGKDYTIELTGGSTIIIKAAEGSNYTGNKDVITSSVEKDYLKSHKIKAELKNADMEYNGERKVPSEALTVKNAAGETLVRNVDYYISCSDNIHAGKVKMVIVGIGAYAGSVKKSFKIKPASGAAINMMMDKSAYEYSKTGVKPQIVVKATVDGLTKVLKEGIDYSCKIKNNKKPGTGSVKLSFKGDYKGAVYGGATDFKINAADADYSNMMICASDMVFTKAGVYKPKVSITINGELLKKTDYEVTYQNGGKMDAPGLMNIGVKLKGKNYTTFLSDINVTARIVSGKTDISKAKPVVLVGGKPVKSVVWKNDSGAEIGIKIKDKIISGDEFKSNFEVTVADYAAPGKATIIIRARSTSDYAGMCTGTIKITKAELGTK